MIPVEDAANSLYRKLKAELSDTKAELSGIMDKLVVSAKEDMNEFTESPAMFVGSKQTTTKNLPLSFADDAFRVNNDDLLGNGSVIVQTIETDGGRMYRRSGKQNGVSVSWGSWIELTNIASLKIEVSDVSNTDTKSADFETI